MDSESRTDLGITLLDDSDDNISNFMEFLFIGRLMHLIV